MSVAHTLKDKLRAGGEPPPAPDVVQVESGFHASSGIGVARDKIGEDLTGPVKAPVPEIATNDPLLAPGNQNVTGAVDKAAEESAEVAGDGNQLKAPGAGFTGEEVELTEAERSAFLEAVVTGKRYYQAFSTFNGVVKGVFRSRLTSESDGVAAHMSHNVRNSVYPTALSYGVELRNVLMAAQVESLNGTMYDELNKPFQRSRNGEVVTEPGWLAQAEYWSNQNEALLVAVYEELRKFEKKYWTMVVHANDQNFWQPVEST